MYHGTPGKVGEEGEFSTEFIGTGEGAQAFGWGLYFAEDRDVAENFYRRRLAGEGSDELVVKGESIDRVVYSVGYGFPLLVIRLAKDYDDLVGLALQCGQDVGHPNDSARAVSFEGSFAPIFLLKYITKS